MAFFTRFSRALSPAPLALAAPGAAWLGAVPSGLFALCAVALGVGVFIGAIGIGGVALPPVLVWGFGFDPHIAAGTSAWSFLFTGLMGTFMYARRSVVPWPFVGVLTAGIVPAALLGALTNQVIPTRIALLPLALLIVAAGLFNLIRRAPSPRAGLPGVRATVLVGAAAGFCSALTGTGGPVFLLPLLMLLGVHTLTAVAAAQVIQVPLAVFAVAGYAAQGSVDFGAGALIGAVACIGVIGGALVAMRLPKRVLRVIANSALVGFGVVIAAVTLRAM